MKTQLILKSLADLPGDAFSIAAAAPGRAVAASKQTVRATRHEIHAARQHSAQFAHDFFARANTPFQSVSPWPRGGINE